MPLLTKSSPSLWMRLAIFLKLRASKSNQNNANQQWILFLSTSWLPQPVYGCWPYFPTWKGQNSSQFINIWWHFKSGQFSVGFVWGYGSFIAWYNEQATFPEPTCTCREATAGVKEALRSANLYFKLKQTMLCYYPNYHPWLTAHIKQQQLFWYRLHVQPVGGKA